MSQFAGDDTMSILDSINDGKHYVPMEQKKTTPVSLSMRVVIVLLGVFSAVAFGVAIWLSIDTSELPHYEQLTQMLGSSKAEIDQVFADQIPAKVKYGSAAFAVSRICSGNTFHGFRYTAVYDQNPELAAKEFYSVIDELTHMMGQPDIDHVVPLATLTRRSLRDSFAQDNVFEATYTWDVTPESGDVAQYLHGLENEENWQGRQGEYLLKPARLYMDLIITYDPQEKQERIEILVAPRPKR